MILNLGNRVVNNYLLTGENGHVLIDTGYERGFRGFRKKLAKANIDPKDIKIIFLSHAHDDHTGFLNEVLNMTDAMVVLHPKAVEGLKRGQNSFEGGCSGRLAYLFCLILSVFGHGDHRFSPLREEFTGRLVTTDSELFRTMDLPFQVIEAPGHTADQIMLLKDRMLFCADAAMNDFPSIHRVIIWIEDLKQYKRTWDVMQKIDPDIIYPAHGKPFKTADLKKYAPYLERIRLFPLKRRQ